MEKCSMYIERVHMTPALAKELLKNNIPNNRNKTMVSQYADMMSSGLWFEGEAPIFIVISKNGSLIDGQNRLSAVIKSGCSIWMYMLKDVDDQSVYYLDQGKKRQAGDIFKISGIPNSRNISSGIGAYISVKNGNNQFTGKILGVNNPAILKEYKTRPDFWQTSYRTIYPWYDAFGHRLSTQFLFAWYVYLKDNSGSLVDTFFEKLCTGINIYDLSDPIHLFRQAMDKEYTSNGIKKMTTTYKTALFIKTWNAFRIGKKIKSLRFDTEREEFPKPIF